MMIKAISSSAGFRPSEAHGGGWEGLWQGGMETRTTTPQIR